MARGDVDAVSADGVSRISFGHKGAVEGVSHSIEAYERVRHSNVERKPVKPPVCVDNFDRTFYPEDFFLWNGSDFIYDEDEDGNPYEIKPDDISSYTDIEEEPDTDGGWSTGKIIAVAFLCSVGGAAAIVGFIYFIKWIISLFSKSDGPPVPVDPYSGSDDIYARSAEELKQLYQSGQIEDIQLIWLLRNDPYTLMLDFIEDDPAFLFTLYQDAVAGEIFNEFQYYSLSLFEYYLCDPSSFTFNGSVSEEQKMFILLSMSASEVYPSFSITASNAFITDVTVSNIVVNSKGHVESWDIDVTASGGYQVYYPSQSVSNPSTFIFQERFEQDLVSLGLDPLVYQPLIDDINLYLQDIYSVSFASQEDMYHLLGLLYTFFEMDEFMEHDTYGEMVVAVHAVLSYFSSMSQDGSLTASEFNLVKNLAETKIDEVFQIQALQQYLEDTYGVVIAFDLDTANLFYDSYGGQKIIPPSYKEILYVLTLLEQTLSIFPEDMFNEENGDRPIIVLLTDHPIRTYDLGGGTYVEYGGYKTGSVLASQDAEYGYDDGLFIYSSILTSSEHILVHEFTHILDWAADNILDEWHTVFDSHSSSYYEQYNTSNFLSTLMYESAWDEGFAWGYGMVSATEDRATILETLYNNWDRVMEWINDPVGNYYNAANPDNSNSVFAQKVYMLIDQLEAVTNGDTSFAFLESMYSDIYGV
ncbi:hypothetical protein ACFL56_02335 [Candidatus Margulisiibacteriota bacterium]